MNPLPEHDLFRDLYPALATTPVDDILGESKPILWDLEDAWQVHLKQYIADRNEHARRDLFAQRRCAFRRGAKLAWVTVMMNRAGHRPFEHATSTKELTYEEAARITRWLQGHNPYHDRDDDLTVAIARKQRYTALFGWLLLEEQVIADEYQPESKDYLNRHSIQVKQVELATVGLVLGATDEEPGTKAYVILDWIEGEVGRKIKAGIAIAHARYSDQVRRSPPLAPGFGPEEHKLWQMAGAPLRAVAKVSEEGEWELYDGNRSYSTVAPDYAQA